MTTARLTSPTDIRNILEQAGIRPSRDRGQNFLVDANILDIIVGAAGLCDRDRVVEIGPGLGVLTERLAEKAGRVVAVELDGKLFKYLSGRMAGRKNVELIHSDVLALDLAALAAPPCKVVANLPYSVAGRVLVSLSELAAPPELVVATIQLEAAERITAAPGCGEYGLLTVLVRSVYDVAIRKVVSATCFWPRPRVRSAVLVMRRRTAVSGDAAAMAFMRELARRGFMKRRKQLAGVLAGGPAPAIPADLVRRALGEMGLRPEARPEDLSPEQWIALSGECAPGMRGE